jgi:signal transduction histidine kinase
VLSVNHQAGSLCGLSAEQIVGKPWWELLESESTRRRTDWFAQWPRGVSLPERAGLWLHRADRAKTPITLRAVQIENALNDRFVKIGTELSGDFLRVSVRDNGHGFKGVSPKEIFNPFFTTKPDGLGLGLTISRSIIEAHRGKLWAQQNPERGATFLFTLPVG